MLKPNHAVTLNVVVLQCYGRAGDFFWIPEPEGEVFGRESDAASAEAIEAPATSRLRVKQFRARVRAQRTAAEVLFLFAKLDNKKATSLGIPVEGNYLCCVAETEKGCVRHLGAKEHLQQQDACRARALRIRERDKFSQQIAAESEMLLLKSCLKSFSI